MRTWSVRLGLAALLFAPLLAMATERAQACIGYRRTPHEALAAADLVFSGTLVRSIPRKNRAINEFDVSAVWKGPHSETIFVEVVTRTETNCPLLRLSVGREYLVYAYETRDSGFLEDVHWETHEYEWVVGDPYWSTGYFTRTTLLSQAQEDLPALRGTALSPWQVRLLAMGAVALTAAGVVTIRRRSESQPP